MKCEAGIGEGQAKDRVGESGSVVSRGELHMLRTHSRLEEENSTLMQPVFLRQLKSFKFSEYLLYLKI